MALSRVVGGRSSDFIATSLVSYKYSSRVHQGGKVEAASSSSVDPKHDQVSSKIRKSLDNDDGRDYEGGSRESGEDLAGFVAEKARKGARKTTETAFDAAKVVAEGMEQTWGAVKETSEKLKESVLGDEHERAQKHRRNDKAADDHLNKNSGDDSKWHA